MPSEIKTSAQLQKLVHKVYREVPPQQANNFCTANLRSLRWWLNMDYRERAAAEAARMPEAAHRGALPEQQAPQRQQAQRMEE